MGGRWSSPTQSGRPPTLEEATRHTYNTVVIPVDGSEQADEAFTWYMDHVHTPDNKVHIVHGHELEYPTGEQLPDYAIAPEEWAEKFEKAIDEGQNVTKRYRDKIKELKIDGEIHSHIGQPGHVIVSAANDLGANMIVMGMHGLGRMTDSFFGQVTHYVIHNSGIPVTVVPDRK